VSCLSDTNTKHPLRGVLYLCPISKTPSCLASGLESRSDVSLRTNEVGSRTLSRFGVEDEQIYLVIRDQVLHRNHHITQCKIIVSDLDHKCPISSVPPD
jgi:hypothetical protein